MKFRNFQNVFSIVDKDLFIIEILVGNLCKVLRDHVKLAKVTPDIIANLSQRPFIKTLLFAAL